MSRSLIGDLDAMQTKGKGVTRLRIYIKILNSSELSTYAM